MGIERAHHFRTPLRMRVGDAHSIDEEDDVDIFPGYVPDEDAVFYVPFEEVGSEFRINTKSRDEMNEPNARRAKLIDDNTLKKALSGLSDG